MKPQRKFAIISLSGVGLILLSFAILAIQNAAMTNQFLRHPNEIVPGCNPGESYGCVTWPFYDMLLAVIGLFLALGGAIGYVEARFPRED